MTLNEMHKLISAYMIGDNVLPSDVEMLEQITHAAMIETATRADSLHLTVSNYLGEILRLSNGQHVIRMPAKPSGLTSLIDIDEDLCPVVARLIARDLSKAKGQVHEAAADRMILDYNAKVYDAIDTIEKATECATGVHKDIDYCDTSTCGSI